MSYCIAQGTLLNVRWQPGWKGCLWDKDTCTCVTESLYCPPETQNIVYQLYSKTKLKIKKKKKKSWLGIQEKNRHSLQRKQGAGVRRKETESVRGTRGRSCSFLENHIAVWLISVTLSSAAHLSALAVHIQIYIFFFIS